MTIPSSAKNNELSTERVLWAELNKINIQLGLLTC